MTEHDPLASCGVRIRRAVPSDAPLLARHRAAVWCEVGKWDAADLEPQVPIWAGFFERCITELTYVASIAEAGENATVVGSGALLVALTIPRPGSASDRTGRLQSVYVAPSMRRRGVASAIVKTLIAVARDGRFVSLTLHPSDEARALYAGFGFVAADEMVLRL